MCDLAVCKTSFLWNFTENEMAKLNPLQGKRKLGQQHFWSRFCFVFFFFPPENNFDFFTSEVNGRILSGWECVNYISPLNTPSKTNLLFFKMTQTEYQTFCVISICSGINAMFSILFSWYLIFSYRYCIASLVSCLVVSIHKHGHSLFMGGGLFINQYIIDIGEFIVFCRWGMLLIRYTV